MSELKLSVVIPAHDEEGTIGATLSELAAALVAADIRYEIIVVNDNSTDRTSDIVREVAVTNSAVRIVDREPPGGFGRAIRTGLAAVTGDVVVICMADRSDDPLDVVRYHRKIEEGYDCVFGSRFLRGASVSGYPLLKLMVNRIVNRAIQLLFWTRHNDLTNAFKAYRASVIRECGPYRASHFNITLEMSLGAIVRRYNVASMPIHWYGRTWGSSKLRLAEMGRRYLSVVLKLFFERVLIRDDLLAERLAQRASSTREVARLREQVQHLEERVERLETEEDTICAAPNGIVSRS